MQGILERLLQRRGGRPELLRDGEFTVRRWYRDDGRNSDLYYPVDWDRPPASRYLFNRAIYGQSSGGTFLSGAVNVALLLDEPVFGIYAIAELEAQPEVRRAAVLDPELSFFMEAANVWFYAHKGGLLYVFDAEARELYEKGEIEGGIEQVLAEWEDA